MTYGITPRRQADARETTFVRVGRALGRFAGLLLLAVVLAAISWLTLVVQAKSYEGFCFVRRGPDEISVRVVDVDVLGRRVTCEFAADGVLHQEVFPDATGLVVRVTLIVMVLVVAFGVAALLLHGRQRRARFGATSELVD